MNGALVYLEFLYLAALAFLVASAYVFVTAREKANKTYEQLVATKKAALSKIAGMNPVELDTYLETMMSMIVQMNIATYGSRNPDLQVELYARSLTDFTNWLGDNWAAIEYYYGHNYPFIWFDRRFKLAVMDGTMSKWINNPLYARNQTSYKDDDVLKAILNNMNRQK